MEKLQSQLHQTKAPSHYVNQMFQSQQMDSNRKKYVKNQEGNVYKPFRPKYTASPSTPLDLCEL